ncbi:DUF2993 domain-containing protein [Actinomyces naeslundii]|uniref:DUF2993 domain-containing protein n=1 Tax=Actinomyces naeslundii TaxID=1655 RepID=A0AA47IQI0_ACTNA|nr:DUF2993 domain-containing protein [Actinomyces naeslundii]OMG12382.1 hypothetical protein BKH07_02955 [Actinomyces naeslundii]OMG15260.1 hypothetical protein BKH04_12080 [Actinomyces naeslundii]OMG22509.1 hypothetical protein BKH05_05265 [Actinomyces naeslundii]WAL43895.1 DUF2993 domain-containing protein [Actinomyces naeslundii]
MTDERDDDDVLESPSDATEASESQEALLEEIVADDSEERDSLIPDRRRPVRRRGRRWLVVLLVLVVVLTAGAVGAEYLVRGQVDAAVRSALPGLSEDARITTKGIVLRQLLGGSLDSLAVDSKSLEITPKGEGGGTVTLSDVDVDLSHISLRSPYPTDTVTASGTISWRQVTALAAREHPKIQGMTLQAKRTGTSAQDPGAIQASAALLGMSGEAEIVPSVRADGNLVLTVTSTRMGGEQIDVDAGENSMLSYVGLDSREITLPSGSLPQGLRPTSAIVTNDGLRLTLVGSRVNLGQL